MCYGKGKAELEYRRKNIAGFLQDHYCISILNTVHIMEKHLHIISLNVPYPADYGGVYDLFYKLPALQQQGVQIHLHCFDYGRGEQAELNKFCAEVFYYHRNTSSKSLFSNTPYIVASRKNEILFQRLLTNEYPVLMEGIHCTALAFDNRFAERKKFVRLHNVEYEYYHRLFKTAGNLVKKTYYWREYSQLKHYEKALMGNITAFWPVTEKDTETYKVCGVNHIEYLPLFIPHWHIKETTGFGSYCLYHGNLEIEENDLAAKWLLSKVFSKTEIPLVIAGKNPSSALTSLAKKHQHTCIVANPSESEMNDMISKAHVHILPSFNSTGIKIKLLNALFNGRHCLVNHAMAYKTGVEQLCHSAEGADAFLQLTEQLYHQPFTMQETQLRKEILHKIFDNTANAAQMVKWIWG